MKLDEWMNELHKYTVHSAQYCTPPLDSSIRELQKKDPYG